MLHNSCINRMGRHRCNKNDDLMFACPSNSSGLRPRLAAQPRPRPQSKDKHMKNTYKEQCKWRILAILDQKIRPEVTAILKKDIPFYITTSYKKHHKIYQTDTPKWSQMAPFWGLGATLEPWCHQGHYLCSNLVPQGPQRDPFEHLWRPWGPTNPKKSP